jgi:hypothetical protein
LIRDVLQKDGHNLSEQIFQRNNGRHQGQKWQRCRNNQTFHDAQIEGKYFHIADIFNAG